MMKTKKENKTKKSSVKSGKTWQLNNSGLVQASVVLSMGAASKLTARAARQGIRPVDYLAGILEAAAKEGR